MDNPNVVNQNNQNNTKAQKHEEIVNKIMNMLRRKGPTLPVHIASETGLSTLFASAFLSELISRKIVKLSSMRIGSSPLYFLSGQEEQLMKFAEYIKGKERDAYDLIMESGVLRDDELEPAIRVAMRSIRDFAFSIQANLDGKEIIFWRFLTTKEDEAKERIRKLLEPAPAPIMPPVPRQVQTMQRVLGYKREEKKEDAGERKRAVEKQKEEKKEDIGTSIFESGERRERVRKAEEKIAKDNRKAAPPSEFINSIRERLKSENIEIIQEIETRKKEALIKVRVNSDFGKIEFLAICKDKKKVSEVELAAALQKAHHEKLPCLFVSPGELDKKASSYLIQWQNLLKFKKI